MFYDARFDVRFSTNNINIFRGAGVKRSSRRAKTLIKSGKVVKFGSGRTVILENK